jgi:hypothetical protein
MSQVTMTVITTKPADVAWWRTVEPEKSAQMAEWLNSYAGITSITYTNVDANTIKTVLTFDSTEKLGTYLVDVHSQPAWISRKVYNTQNGIMINNSYAYANS